MSNALEIMDQAGVDALLLKFAQPGITNEPVLMVDVLEMQRLANKGYPIHMYHPTLKPVVVINAAQKNAMNQAGYGARYIFHEWPRMFFRRNMAPKFEDGPLGDFVEGRTFENQAKYDAGLKERPPKTAVGNWVQTIDDLPSLDQGEKEAPEVENARLKAEIAKLKASKKKVA